MASSNRSQWPSMFKSKPSNSTNHQWQHDINSPHISTGHHKNTRTNPSPVPGCEERTPKPRWNPRPEQIRLLESIFNSGRVNPSRDEIRKIRVQLQEYGHVGDANVFYWFQNRKSRSKQKQRQLLQNNNNNDNKSQLKQQGFCFADISCVTTGCQENVGNCSKKDQDGKMKMQQEYYTHTVNPRVSPPLSVSSPTNHALQGAGLGEPSPHDRMIVFINDICFEIADGPFNVRETFGDDVVLLHSSGQPVLTNEWGLTHQSLQNGAFYYLLRTFTPTPHIVTRQLT